MKALRPVMATCFVSLIFGCRGGEPKGEPETLKKVDEPGRGIVASFEGARAEVQAKGPKSATMPDDEVHRSLRGQKVAFEGHGQEVDLSSTDGHPLPLKKEGLGSAWELERALKGIPEEEQKRRFEEGFRLAFCADRGQRDYDKARKVMEGLLKEDPSLPQAHRVLAYLAVVTGFDVEKARLEYEKALQANPEYGEVHYALAFLLAMSDREKGAAHYARALALGIPDFDGLSRLYGPQGQ